MPDGMILTAVRQTAGELVIRDVENEPRILDLDLAERLGFAKPTKIRDLIKRHKPALEAMGTVPTVGTVNRGQHATEFYLNRQQALFLTMKSETQTAIKVTTEVIRRFDAYERGGKPEAGAVPAINLRDRGQLLAITLQLAREFEASQAQVQTLEANVAELVPRAAALQQLTEAGDSLCLSDAAKDTGIKPSELTDVLCQRKWIFKRDGKGEWIANQVRLDSGDLVQKWIPVKDRQGKVIRTRQQTRVTPKGLAKIARHFAERRAASEQTARLISA